MDVIIGNIVELVFVALVLRGLWLNMKRSKPVKKAKKKYQTVSSYKRRIA